jgi:hypothetical protein
VDALASHVSTWSIKAEAELAIQVLKKRCQLEWKSGFDQLNHFERVGWAWTKRKLAN